MGGLFITLIRIPGAKFGWIIFAVPNYQLTPHPSDVLAAIKQDRENLYFADVHARGAYPKCMDRYFKDSNIVISIMN